jgi:hypothetical protein
MKQGVAAVLTFAVVTAAQQAAAPALTPVGRGRISAIYDVKADASYLYALERGIVHVLDARAPAELREVGAVEFNRPRVRMALRHPYLYLTGFNEPLGIVNVADPAHPRWLGDAPELTRTANDGFELAGDYGYLIRNGERSPAGSALSLDVLDLATDPAQPKQIGTMDLGLRVAGEYGGMSYEAGRLFVLVGRTAGTAPRSRLIVIDVRRPAQPRIERTLFLPAEKLYKDVEVRGELVYLLQPEGAPGKPAGLAIYRMRDSGDLELVGEALTNDVAIPIDLIVAGDVVYATFKVGGLLATFDVSQPSAPTISHIYQQRDLWAAGLGMTLVGDRLYVSGDNGPGPIFDVSVPRTPRLLGRYEFEGGSASAVLVERDLAIVTSLSDLILYDVANPAAPRRVGRYKGIPSFDHKDFQFNVVASASGRRAFVSYETRAAQLVDLSDPAHPRVLSTYKPRGLVHSSVLTPTHAALGYEESAPGHTRGGIEIVALQDAGHPRMLAVLDLDQPVHNMVLRANRLAATHPNGELTIVDVTDWKHPIVLGRLATTAPGPAPQVGLSQDGRTAYLTRADARSPDRGVVTVIDLRDATQPRTLSRLEIPISGGTDMPLAVQGTAILIVAGTTGGIALVDAGQPAQPVLTRIEALAGGYAEGLAVNGRNVLIAAAEDGLLVYRR